MRQNLEISEKSNGKELVDYLHATGTNLDGMQTLVDEWVTLDKIQKIVNEIKHDKSKRREMMIDTRITDTDLNRNLEQKQFNIEPYSNLEVFEEKIKFKS